MVYTRTTSGVRRIPKFYAGFALFCLGLSIFMPSSPVLGGQRPWLIFTSVVMCAGLVFFLLNQHMHGRGLATDSTMNALLVFFYAYCIVILLALLFNTTHVFLRDFGEFLRLFIYIQMLMVGYLYGGRLTNRAISRWMLIFLCVELAIVILQYNNLFGSREIFGFFWSDKKALLGKRGAGSLGNPNLMGVTFLMLYCGTIFVKPGSWRRRVIVLLLTVLGVFMTGSRTTLLTFIPLVLFAVILRGRLKIASFAKVLIIGVLLIYLVGVILVQYGEMMPYMSEISIVFERGLRGVQNIGTYNARIRDWTYKLSVFESEPNYVRLVGAGPRKEGPFQYLDNQYLFVYIRYGLFGVMLYLSMWSYIIFSVLRRRTSEPQLSNFLLGYFVVLLISGLAAETLSSWRLVPPFFWALGILIRRTMPPNKEVEID